MTDPEVTDVIAELDRRVRTDDLTQLGSKAQMVEWLETAASGSKLALLDLDDFRLLNQTLGHDAGDVLLTLVARRLERACPEPDYRVGRISQDEFAVLQVGADADAEQLASVVASTFRDPFRVGGRAVGVRATCGITECAPTKSPTTVIREADTAMYEAKARAKSGALVFDEVYHRRAVEAFELADGLGRAVAGSEFDIHYQPEVDLARGRVVGAEALLRWTNPRLGAVPPDTFIPIAETCGMIGELGAFVLRGALAQRRRWIAEGVVDDDFTMAVNVSARQIDSDGFGDLVAWQLEVTGCPSRAALPGAHRVGDHGRSGGGRHPARAPGETGRSAGDRRLRHRLLVAGLPPAPADHASEDRPEFRGPVGRASRGGAHRGDHRHRPGTGPGDGGRGDRDARAAPAGDRPRLRRRAGVPLRPADAAERLRRRPARCGGAVGAIARSVRWAAELANGAALVVGTVG
ncbi:MAG TPA: EAL domain-containing protein [Microthrixaceae bacterium]|jgi:diguanylate cyclase (GGDEF)-like protein|nr:EAL domain-containing protein [Microthrixaceae bacterium]